MDEVVNPDNTALISEMRDRIRYLEEESRRKDEIIMQQALTMRQLTAPAVEPSESPETASSGEGDTPPSASEQPRASWWRRLFFGLE